MREIGLLIVTAVTTMTISTVATDADLDDANAPEIDGTVEPTEPCSCAASFEGACAEDYIADVGKVLQVVEDNERYVVYEAPTSFLTSMTWGGGYLWLSDLSFGIIYKTQVGQGGIEILESIKVPRDPFMQARDMTWDADGNLWSLNWGDVIRHDMSDPLLTPNIWITEGEIGSPNLHHMKGLAFDGEHIWSALDGGLYRHSADDYAIEATYENNAMGAPAGMDFKDGTLWVANRNGGFIHSVDIDEGTPTATYSMVEHPMALAWSETNLWLYDWVTKRIYMAKSLPADGESWHPDDRYLETDSYTEVTSIEGDTVLDIAGSPYVMDDGVGVPPGTTLTIEAGVELYMGYHAVISVSGTLLIAGTVDAPVLITHKDPNTMWGLIDFAAESGSTSEIRHALIQYNTDGIKGGGVPGLVEGSVIRRTGVDVLNFALNSGDFGDLVFRGNVLGPTAGAGLKMIIAGGTASVDSLTFQENVVHYTYGQFILEAAGGKLDPWPAIDARNNIFEYGFRGVGGGFPCCGGAVFQDNWLYDSPSGSGVQPFHEGSTVSHNLIEFTREQGYQLHPGHLVTDTVFEYNTVRSFGLEPNWGDSSIRVENNNFVAFPFIEQWLGSPEAGATWTMENNWWGSADVEAIRSHLRDAAWVALYDPDSSDALGDIDLEPILNAPNGIGFIEGTVTDSVSGASVSRAAITWGDQTIHTSADGRFFGSAQEGTVSVSISADGYVAHTVDVVVCSGSAASATIALSSYADFYKDTVVSIDISAPDRFSLSQNYPNPSNPTTSIAYSLPEASDVTLTIYAITGQRVATLVSEHQEAGHYVAAWDGMGFGTGVYLYRLEAGDFVETRKALLLR